MTLRWTHLDAATVPQWADLTNLLGEVDGTEEFYGAQDLAEELEEPGFDPGRDTLAVWAADRLVGYGQLRVSTALNSEGQARANLGGGVHPQWRGRGIGRQLMDGLEARARELVAARHPGAPARMEASGGLEGDPVRRLLKHRGYRTVRYFTEMQRSLPGEPLPGGGDPRIEPYRPPLQEAVRLAHNDAFATHWGSTPRSAEAWHDQLSSRTFRPGTSVVCLDEAGEVLAYVLTYQWVDRELYIGQVGTRERARGQGLARACVLASLQAAAEAGEYDLVDLSVDSVSPTGAGALYESVGFVLTKTFAVYARVLGDPVST